MSLVLLALPVALAGSVRCHCSLRDRRFSRSPSPGDCVGKQKGSWVGEGRRNRGGQRMALRPFPWVSPQRAEDPLASESQQPETTRLKDQFFYLNP